MTEPSVKGTIVEAVAEELVRLRDEGRVSPEELEFRLEAEDLALLDSKISTASWYPMASYTRLLELMGKIEGGGNPDYFRERGRANARRLLEAGLYQQLGFLSRWGDSVGDGETDTSNVIKTYANKLKLVVSLAKSIYNVGQWEVEPDADHPKRLRIATRDAADYSEPMRLAAEGFLNECATERGRPASEPLYISERPSPDLILFRMSRDIPALAKRYL